MPQDPRARALLIHIAAYAAVVGICTVVNLWLNPHKLWFIWVAAGWGIGVAAHGFAYWLRHAHRRERVFVDPRARGFTVHLFAYVAVVILLFVVNLVVTPNTWWFYWVALSWGAGIALHGWLAFRKRRSGSDMKQSIASSTPPIETARKPQPAAKPQRKSPPPKEQATVPKKQNTPRKKPAAVHKRPTPKR